MTYKRFDIAVEAFSRLGLPLKIIGRGPDFKKLKKMAKSNIEFTGRLSDKELFETYANAKAFVFPQEEDFGLVAIEALASGRPLIAFRSGDIVENAKEGESGIFFSGQNEEALKEALEEGIVAGGGVAANSRLRERLAAEPHLEAVFPSPALCTDNAAMVAGLGWRLLQDGQTAGLDLNAEARVSMFKRRYP